MRYRTSKSPVYKIKHSRIALLGFFFMFGLHGESVAQDHLLLSEITLQPAEAEFIEIYNPTDFAVSLDNYYLADNQNYPYLSGVLPAIDLGDFIVQFPAGSTINAHEALVVAVNGDDFELYYGFKADFEIYDTDVLTENMIVTSENTILLTNAGEGIALFEWNGIDAIVQDVDLMNAGSPNASSEIVDKTGIAGYLPDAHTMPLQSNGPAGSGFSTKRILLEGANEIHSGGNGITGDDETSEDITITWDDVYTVPTPGTTILVSSGTENMTSFTNSMKVFPNPTNGDITISLGQIQEIIEVQIMDIQGQVVYQHEINYTGPFDLKIIDTSGVYIVSVSSSSEKYARIKVIKK